MSSTYETTTDDLSRTAQEYITLFIQHEKLDSRCRIGEGSWTDTVENLDFSGGIIINDEKSMGIVFDEPELSDIYLPARNLDDPIVDVELMTHDKYQDGEYEFGLFTTESGMETAISVEYTWVIEQVYDIDLFENPAAAFSNGDDHMWPIKVPSPIASDNTYIIIAPIRLSHPINK